jgi:hypothetical protein
MKVNKHEIPFSPSYTLIPRFFECDGKEGKKTTDFCSVLTKAPPPVYAGVGAGLAIGAGIITAFALTTSAPVTVPVVLTSVTLLTVLGVSGIYVGNCINESQNQSNSNPTSKVEKPRSISRENNCFFLK